MSPTLDEAVEFEHTLRSVLRCSWSGNIVVFLVRIEWEIFRPARISGPPEDCCPAEGGVVKPYQIELILNSEWKSIPMERLKEISEVMEDIKNHVYDDELYSLAEQKHDFQRELNDGK